MKAWVTVESVDHLLRKHGFVGEIDTCGIDLDGNDYWIWQAINAITPRIVVTEYNSFFPPDRALTITYDPNHKWPGGRYDGTPRCVYYGASIAALAKLAAQKGYRLVAGDPRGINAFWLRSDVAPEIPAMDPSTVWRPSTKSGSARVLAAMGDEDPVSYFGRFGLTLIEVD